MNKTSASYLATSSCQSSYLITGSYLPNYYTSSYLVTGEFPVGTEGFSITMINEFSTYKDSSFVTYKDPTQDPINLKSFEEAIEKLEKIRTKKRILKNSLNKGLNFLSIFIETLINAK